MTERVTLITGASAGIGAELARVFASNGHRVAMVARRADRLTALAGEIVAAGGPEPIVIACDLEQPDAGDKIAAALAAAGVEVDYVVNNAGFGLFGNAIELRSRRTTRHHRCQHPGADRTVTAIFRKLIKHRGGILNVGSIAGFLPGPGMASTRIEGLCAVVLGGAARRTGAARRPCHRALSGAGAVRISGAGGVQPGLIRRFSTFPADVAKPAIAV